MIFNIRPARPSDTSHLNAVSAECGLFSQAELPVMAQDIDAWSRDETNRLWLLPDGSSPQGAAMLAPEEMSDNVWNLLFLGVSLPAQRKGLGRALLGAAEAAVRDLSARMLLIDTASSDDFRAARALYLSAGYVQEAVIRGFYGEDLDRVTFAKRFDWP